MIKEELTIVNAKKIAGETAAKLIRNGMLVGLGTGSTAAFFIEALGKRCKEEGLQITAVASSTQSLSQAKKVGIPLVNDHVIDVLDITVDGADEIDKHNNMIKGGGGALLREKILACSTKEMVVIIDENKRVDNLGSFPVPVEITRFAYHTTLSRIQDHGYPGALRLNHDNSIYVTDNGNYIFDIRFDKPILNPKKEHERLRSILGVLETGLFFDVVSKVIIGYLDGTVKVLS